ncbi:hypothetical protein J0J30_24475, partial [Vibrio vulnificus]|nr:hypothetical protein [Vibrio vulnificus]
EPVKMVDSFETEESKFGSDILPLMDPTLPSPEEIEIAGIDERHFRLLYVFPNIADEFKSRLGSILKSSIPDGRTFIE